MAVVSGSRTTAGVSAVMMLRPGQTLVADLSVGSTKSFEGTVQIEESPNQQAWAIARDNQGTLLTYTYLVGAEKTAGSIVSATVLNTHGNRMFYRVNAPVVTQDPVVYALTDNATDVIATVLRDHLGRPLLGVRQDGSIAAIAKIYATAGLASSDATVVVTDTVISAADIVATGAGKLGHASGYPLVAGGGADVMLEFLSAVLVYDRATATYGDGGNLTINLSGGGAALTGLLSAANSIGAAADKIGLFRPLATAAELVTANKGFNLVSSAAFTNPGTAAGVVRIRSYHRAYTLGLA